MQLVSRKNFLIFLAAILVVALGFMALTLAKQQKLPTTNTYQREITKMQSQSDSDRVNDIENDLNETDFSDVDKELQDIDKELNSY
ncbi:hypothetical protein A2865_04190 [Candidatus Woesebacteria bacterium RIFCSPHIGHO2_01_FULL_39_17]|uniref:Uncharacterized protein n=3 Tax=Candidatus Woeseibacteriota TaxID=1752722 RepID=A0A0G0NN47_9BACT|nr:MAG: hypothetical protein US72_C0005G0072 [Microgenomates group bacterium GW2011_GWC1_38_12]KKQ94269.1 MAG: hypothetical protein UT19_C0003G0074 [Candidatus Woesebacteria bacterium GW2011_GWB1_39_10b]KKR14206.1 MAG: hypothetical protein UT40_C0004G0029 [Candidatus Woesebacteria bacterium GW2011_GWA1_39_21b]OGM22657.1 MAG: hypothetical protein A2865_04190 [Candidatus Woesebacteria bacterium RIFCSPHIGHO2_01_FULL_39_17]OGM63574.1 MAG: hypothetical protein A3A52_01140 [Candidatus Woesebacteria b